MKLLRAISLLLRTKKIWLPPNKYDVLIFDSRENHPIEVELAKMLSPYGTIGLFVHPGTSGIGKINIPVLLSSILKRGNRYTSYCDSYIRRVNPRIVITYIDNNSEFYSVVARNITAKTILIQNGLRNNDIFELLDSKPSEKTPKVDFMLVFGNHIGSKYAKYISGSVIPIGSFRNNYVPRVRPKVKGTLSFISQYRDTTGFELGGIFYIRQQLFEQVDHIILPFLAIYAKDKGLKFRVIPCSGHLKDSSILRNEKRHYRGILGSECEFFEWEWHGSSYDAVDSTEVVVSVGSSLGIEAMARGTKSAIFSIHSTILYPLKSPYVNWGWPGCYPDEGSFWTSSPTTASFRRILDHLFTISDEQWRSELKQHGFQEVMQFDPDNSKLRAILANELGSASGI